MHLSKINNLLNKFLVRSKSANHEHSLGIEPVKNVRPIWLHGFARSGTTSAMYRLSNRLGRNAVFEPGHKQFHDQIPGADFDDVVMMMKSVPRPDRWEEYFVGDGILSSFETFGSDLGELNQWKRFCAYIDYLYEFAGHNVVIKEIRLFANLPAIARYHQDRSLDWLFIGIICSPVVPLNSYYRRGWLSGDQLRKYPPEIDQANTYRLDTFRRLNRFPELTELPADSPSEKLLLNCLLDHAELRRFVSEDPENRLLTSLDSLNEAVDWVLDRTQEEVGLQPTPDQRVTRTGHGVDQYFYRDVIEPLNPSLRDALEAQWGSIHPDSMASNGGFRRYLTSLRHRLFSH
ncbi:MAG: hypothetical protein CBC35_10295 [Planctomycetes bacterium TMED75]|nr:hypothetical protein [Planctomycetaceae bacterium]OUU91146.1 MAG: hypothetical protein CBC35_10295 [Planctomycetes bacterium TMED75]